MLPLGTPSPSRDQSEIVTGYNLHFRARLRSGKSTRRLLTVKTVRQSAVCYLRPNKARRRWRCCFSSRADKPDGVCGARHRTRPPHRRSWEAPGNIRHPALWKCQSEARQEKKKTGMVHERCTQNRCRGVFHVHGLSSFFFFLLTQESVVKISTNQMFWRAAVLAQISISY